MKKIVLAALLMVFIVIGLGAYTRLSHSGLGCPDWPGCYGFLSVPEQAHELLTAESRFPDHYIEPTKGWIEMIHRYAAGFALALVLVLVCLSMYKKNNGSKRHFLKHCCLILMVILLQAAFGMWTVTLKLWPQVVTAHLLGGFTTFSLLYLLYLRLNKVPYQKEVSVWLKCLAPVVLFITMLQVFLGGWVASNYAAFACPDFPTCQGAWWPQMDFEAGLNITQSVGPNYLGGLLDGASRTAIHVAHRLGAILTFIAISGLAFYIFIIDRKIAIRLICLLIFQIVLGVSNVMLQVPIQIAVLHNLVALILLVSVLEAAYVVLLAKKRSVYEHISRFIHS